MSDDIPHWAKERACELANKESGRHSWFPADCNQGYTSLTALARYIAEHEEPPVDQDLIKAREICARVCLEQGRLRSAQNYREGFYDATEVQFVLTALKEAHNA